MYYSMSRVKKHLSAKMSIAPKTLLQSTAFFHLSMIKRRQCCAQNRFWNPRQNFWEYIIKMIWKLFLHELFKYFGDNRQNTYWSIIILKVCRTLFESRCYIGWFERFSVFDEQMSSLNWRVICSVKKFAFFFQNLDRDIVVLHSFSSIQTFYFLKYIIFIYEWKITWITLRETVNSVNAWMVSILHYGL